MERLPVPHQHATPLCILQHHVLSFVSQNTTLGGCCTLFLLIQSCLSVMWIWRENAACSVSHITAPICYIWRAKADSFPTPATSIRQAAQNTPQDTTLGCHPHKEMLRLLPESLVVLPHTGRRCCRMMARLLHSCLCEPNPVGSCIPLKPELR